MVEVFSEQDADLRMIVADMAREFLEGCEDRLEEIDAALTSLRNGEGSLENEILEIKRHTHSLKGMGTTFGFSAISLLAHSLEDYFETMFGYGKNGIYDVQLYIDRIREIVEMQENLSDDAVSLIIRNLPLKAKSRTIRKHTRALSILILMPKGLQRKIVGSELSQFGFSVLIAENSIDAIEKGMRLTPDLFMASMVSDEISGIELAGVFSAIKTTASNPFLLVASSEVDQQTQDSLTPNVHILRKGPKFSQDLLAFFSSQGYVVG